MQSWIVDKDFYKSASMLDTKRLQANIYENIHILASLLYVNDKLITPKRSVINHPNAKLWVGYERELLCYIAIHLDEWMISKKHKSEKNLQNFHFLRGLFSGMEYLTIDQCQKYLNNVKWITEEFIQRHRAKLIQKEIDKENKLLKMKESISWIKSFANEYELKAHKMKMEALDKKIANNYHYRNLWYNCKINSNNTGMRYNW